MACACPRRGLRWYAGGAASSGITGAWRGSSGALCESKKLEPNEEDRCVNANYNVRKKRCRLCSKVLKVKFEKGNHVAYAAVQEDQAWDKISLKVGLLTTGIFFLGAAAAVAVMQFLRKGRAGKSRSGSEFTSPVSPVSPKMMTTSNSMSACVYEAAGSPPHKTLPSSFNGKKDSWAKIPPGTIADV